MEPKSKDCVCVIPGVMSSDSHVELAKTSHGLVFRTLHEGQPREPRCTDIEAAPLVRWIVGPGRSVLAEHGVPESIAHNEALIRLDVAEKTFPKLHEEIAKLKAEASAASQIAFERDDLASRLKAAEDALAKARAACVVAGFSEDVVARAGVAGIIQSLDGTRNGWAVESGRHEAEVKRLHALHADACSELALSFKQLVEATGANSSTATWEEVIADVRSTYAGARDISQATQDLVGVLSSELAGAITAETVRTAIRALKREARDALADRDRHAEKATSMQAFREKVCAMLRCGPNVAEAIDKITRLQEAVAHQGANASALEAERKAHAETKRHWDELLSSVSQALIDAHFMPDKGGSCVEAIRLARRLLDESHNEVARLEAEMEAPADDDEEIDGDGAGCGHLDVEACDSVARALHAAIAVDEFDWTSRKAHAFVYQIVVGCERDALDELAERFGWGFETVEYLVTLHEAFGAILHGMSVS